MVGNFDDETLHFGLKILAQKSDKNKKIYHSVWDDSLRKGGRVSAEISKLRQKF
jgi:hypothetical protein